MDRVLVTPRSVTKDGHPTLSRLAKAGFEVVLCRPGIQPDEDELRGLLPGCAGYLAGVEPVTARVLDAADRLRVISRNGTGIDNIDLAKAREKRIAVCRAEGANARGVAELTFAHILAAVRAIPVGHASVRAGGWERVRGIELAGRTLGVVGCGAVGRIVSSLALGFDMRVLAHDPYADGRFAPSPRFDFAPLERVLAEADIVTLHCPAPANGPLIDEAALARMKRRAYLINTARASLLDDGAVLRALEDGRLAGVTLDVFATEPPVDRRLAEHPRVIATPHVGGFTEESVSRAVAVAVDNLIRELRRPAVP